jgi:hypothetical protein
MKYSERIGKIADDLLSLSADLHCARKNILDEEDSKELQCISDLYFTWQSEMRYYHQIIAECIFDEEE